MVISPQILYLNKIVSTELLGTYHMIMRLGIVVKLPPIYKALMTRSILHSRPEWY